MVGNSEAPKAKTNFGQTPVLVSALMACHDVVGSVQALNLTAPSLRGREVRLKVSQQLAITTSREAYGVDAGKVKDLCDFVKCPGVARCPYQVA